MKLKLLIACFGFFYLAMEVLFGTLFSYRELLILSGVLISNTAFVLAAKSLYRCARSELIPMVIGYVGLTPPSRGTQTYAPSNQRRTLCRHLGTLLLLHTRIAIHVFHVGFLLQCRSQCNSSPDTAEIQQIHRIALRFPRIFGNGTL